MIGARIDSRMRAAQSPVNIRNAHNRADARICERQNHIIIPSVEDIHVSMLRLAVKDNV